MERTQRESSLLNKKVIILGGSSGIGRATAKEAAEQGASVVIVSSNQNRINTALKELPENCSGNAIDLSNPENIKDFFDRTGSFDHLIYTAGENLNLTSISSTDLEKAKEFFTIRFWGALAAVKYGASHISKGGSISLMSGIASQRPGPGWALASSICGAMEGLCRALAVELAPIRVNVVLPGVVQTNLWDSIPQAEREKFYQSVGDSLLLKRVGRPEDIAQAFVFLMKQGFATGQSFVIDGGAALV